MWTGIVTRKYAEYVMGAASAAGGFVATDLPLDSGFLALLPDGWDAPADGRAIPPGEFRARLIRENSCLYLGRDEPNADHEGFATQARIQTLLDALTGADPHAQHRADAYDAAQEL